MHGRIRLRAVGLPILMLVCSSQALAQTDEQRAAARSLATEGATAFKESRYKDAADLFSKAESLLHAPPHLLFMARSYVKLGQLVKAREAYLKITREDLAPNVPAAFKEAKSSAVREISGVESKIGGLTIKVEGGDAAKDLQVKVDGALIPGVLVGASQPVDPGEHRVEAAATGFRAQPRSLVVGEGEKASVTITLEADPNAAVAVGAVPVAAGTAGTGAASGSGTPPSSGGSPAAGDTGGSSDATRIGAYAAFGVGAVGIGLGTIFLLKAGSKRSDADALCGPNPSSCNVTPGVKEQINSLDSDADSARTVGIIGLAVGGAAVATGVVLIVMGGPSDTKSATQIHPWVGLNSAGVYGSF